MTTLEDKILGIKKDYYCSSSESEGEDSDGCDDGKIVQTDDMAKSTPDPTKWDGSSKNTGPKGVIRDWELFKKHENDKLIDQDLQKVALAKKLTLSSSQNQGEEEIDQELMDLMSEDFLLEYQKKRMEEMMTKPPDLPKFGSLIHLKNGNDLLEAVDNENKQVTVVIHIYEEANSGCKTMNKCLSSLCKQYPTVKFCKIVGSSAGMSLRFKLDGVPALLVYKEGSVIGNFVRVTDELGDEFYDSDVENFLIEHGILSDRFSVPAIIQAEEEDAGNGSDWSLE